MALHKRLTRSAGCIVIGTLASCGSSGPGSPPTAFFVSPDGNDAFRGSLIQPFRTLARAQAAMRITGNPKVVYARAGTYSNVALLLTAADDGESWNYYPPDGYDSAILDGGSSSPTTGGNPITIDGGSNIKIDGFTIRNARN